MKTIFLLAAVLTAYAAAAQGSRVKAVIAITKTTPYCGGANPPREILEAAKKPKAAAGENFYIIRGAQNSSGRTIVSTISFNKSASCTVQLLPGTYSVINAFRLNKPADDRENFDMDCLLALWKKPLFTFTVKAGRKNRFAHNIEELCPYIIPCSTRPIAEPM